MKKIIVTLTNQSRHFTYDIELPINMKMEQLSAQIREVISAFAPNVMAGLEQYTLYCERIGRNLVDDETLEEAGVWNGDYLMILPIW